MIHLFDIQISVTNLSLQNKQATEHSALQLTLLLLKETKSLTGEVDCGAQQCAFPHSTSGKTTFGSKEIQWLGHPLYLPNLTKYNSFMFQKIFETLETFIAMCCQYEKDI
jgi:hypothetical protein